MHKHARQGRVSLALQVSTGTVISVTDAREEKYLSPWVQLPVKIVRRENTAMALGQEKRAEIAQRESINPNMVLPIATNVKLVDTSMKLLPPPAILVLQEGIRKKWVKRIVSIARKGFTVGTS
jgi:hypothetical protein